MDTRTPPSRITRPSTDPIHATVLGDEWRLIRQGLDSWWEHTPCGRTFYLSVDRTLHTCPNSDNHENSETTATVN